MRCRLLNLALLGAIIVLLRTMQRTPKCPHCAARADMRPIICQFRM
jgi:hypothetical protein